MHNTKLPRFAKTYSGMSETNQSLTQKVPFLFALPASGGALNSVYNGFFLLIAGSSLHLFSSILGGKLYFIGFSAILICHAILAIISSNANLIFLFRYFLVWLLIFAVAITWAVWDGDVKVAPFGANYQSIDVTRVLVFAGFLSLNGSFTGWLIGCRSLRSESLPSFQLPHRYRSLLWMVGAVLALLFSVSYFFAAGGIVSSESYYGSGKGVDLQFSVFNIFQYIGISLLILSSAAFSPLRKKFIWLAILTLIIGMLVGSRADYMPQALLLLLIIFLRPLLGRFRQLSFVKAARLAFYGFTLILIAFFLGGFIAQWRFSGNITDSFSFIISSEYTGLLNYSYGHPVLWLETGSMAIGTLYAAIVNVKIGLIGLHWGSSYLDWILKLPPQFLGLPRPEGLEWSASIGGQIMSQGGIFEVSEAYWNFGLVGCFVVSFLISYLLAYLLQRGLRRTNLFNLLWYLTMGFMSLRGIWYQNFTYFRLFSIMMLLYIAAKGFAPWFICSFQSARLLPRFRDSSVL